MCPARPKTMSLSQLRFAEGSDECDAILPSHSFPDTNTTPRGELSVLRSSFQISTMGKLLMQQA